MNEASSDGKQVRKSVKRRYVDAAQPICHYVETRGIQRDFRDVHAAQPHVTYKRFCKPPIASRDNPIASVCTRFCHVSVNHQRCPVNAAAWAPGGRRLISGNQDGEFTLWDGTCFKFETIQTSHDEAINALEWSPDEAYLITGDDKGMIKLFDPQLTLIGHYRGHERAKVNDLSFSPSSQKLVSASDDKTLAVWDYEREHKIASLTGHGWDVKCVDWHPSMSLIGSGSRDSTVRLWDPASGRCLRTQREHKGHVTGLHWNNSGNALATCSSDHSVRIFDLRMMRNIQVLKGHPREVTSCKFHPHHENLLVSGGFDGSLLYWLLGEEEPVARVHGAHRQAVWDLQWHPVGHVLATASNDGTCKFWSRSRHGELNVDRQPGATEVGGWRQDLEGANEGAGRATGAPPLEPLVIPGVGAIPELGGGGKGAGLGAMALSSMGSQRGTAARAAWEGQSGAPIGGKGTGQKGSSTALGGRGEAMASGGTSESGGDMAGGSGGFGFGGQGGNGHNGGKGSQLRSETRIVYVGDVPVGVTAQQLHQLYAQFGTVAADIRVLRPREGSSTTCAFVPFATVDEARRAVHETRDICFQGIKLNVNFGQDQSGPGGQVR
jgi:polyadenylation factor subunit 2